MEKGKIGSEIATVCSACDWRVIISAVCTSELVGITSDLTGYPRKII